MAEHSLTAGSIALRGGGLAVLAGILWATDGRSGVALVAVVGVVWMLIQTPYAVAVGELLYAVGVTESGTFGVIGAVSFGILFVPGLIRQWRPKAARIAIVALVVATAALAASALVESVPLAALVSGFGFSVAAYSVHRYESVRFGVVDPNP